MAPDLETLFDNAALRRLRELTQERHDAIVHVLDPDLGVLWASPVGSRAIFGRELPHFVGRRVTEFIHADDVEALEDAFGRARRGDSATWTGRSHDHAGRFHDVRTILWTIPDGEGFVYVGVTLPLAAGS